MMKQGWVVMMCALAGGAALAESSRPTVAVLDLEAKGATALEADAASLGVARGLRELDVFEVLSSQDVRQLLAIERNRQLLGGEGDDAKLSGMGKILGAQHVVAGSLTRIGDKLQAELRLLEVVQAKVISQKTTQPLAGIEPLAAALPALAQELVGPLLRDQQGSLLVRTSEEAAEVVVDDVLVASTPMSKPVLLPRGSHRLVVRKDGFIAQARTVRIAPSSPTTEEISFVPSADYAEAYRLRHGRLRVGAYLATAAAAGLFAGAYLLDRNVTEPTYQEQFLPRRLALREEPIPGPLSTEKSQAIWLACGANPEACTAEIRDFEGALRTQQVATAGLVVLGAAAAGTATYLWLTGQDPNRYSGVVAGLVVGSSPGLSLGGAF